ncbi:hypothetical protein AB0D12_40885 [Streptomyces sp. NPDC048479]|uniref:hypothetical protein n=1 Tax=Streptomyces sp. NPDC048479 TaxID=3154725 RepID=UPI0034318347
MTRGPTAPHRPWPTPGSQVLFHAVLAFDGDGVLCRHYCTVSRYGFDISAAVASGAWRDIVTVPAHLGALSLIIRHNRGFPVLFRSLIHTGTVAVPTALLEYLRLLACTRTESEHGGVRHAGHGTIIAPWLYVLAESNAGKQVLTDEFGMGDDAAGRIDRAVRRDRAPVVGAPRTC